MCVCVCSFNNFQCGKRLWQLAGCIPVRYSHSHPPYHPPLWILSVSDEDDDGDPHTTLIISGSNEDDEIDYFDFAQVPLTSYLTQVYLVSDLYVRLSVFL